MTGCSGTGFPSPVSKGVSMGLRVTHKRDRASRKPVVAKAANGFDFAVTHLGDSKWVGADGKPVGVWYDPNDSNSQAMAADVLIKIDDLMTYCDSVFGVKGKSGNVIITSQVGGGAYHFGCSFNADAPGSDWYETNEGTVGSSLIYFGLVMAEVSESYMGLQAKGWNCGGSGGEGLSRVLAEIVSGGSNGAMGASGYAAGPSYDGTDWISADQGSDRDYPSTGCAVLYCWWMMSQGFTIQQIVQAGESDGTLASNYSKLTGLPATQAFTNFQVAVSKVGGPGAFSVDNPFHAPEQPYPTGVPVPPGPPVPMTGMARSTS